MNSPKDISSAEGVPSSTGPAPAKAQPISAEAPPERTGAPLSLVKEAPGAGDEGRAPARGGGLPPGAGPSEPAPAKERLRSLDALRGFDMFWILGAGTLVAALGKMADNDFTRFLSGQLRHVEWAGMVFYDLIFPLFLFIVGVSAVFSLDRSLERDGTARTVARVVRRSVLLYVLGILYTGGLSKPWPEIALGGVLHRIAACYLCAALLYVCVRKRWRAIAGAAAALLVGYWALMTFVPFPNIELRVPARGEEPWVNNVEAIAGRIGSHDPAAIAAAAPQRVRGLYEEHRNLSNYLDFRFLPGKKMAVYYINEGLLSTLPSVAICLFGMLAALLLQGGASPGWKVGALLLGGALLAGLGLLWSLQFPLIKRIWTSSFCLVAAGCSAGMLAVFHWIVDVRGWSRWCAPFVWIGMNPITLYLSTKFISYTKSAEMFLGGDVKAFLDGKAQGLGDLAIALGALGLVFLLAWFLHRRRIFLRV